MTLQQALLMVGGATWQTATSQTLDTDSGGWSGYNLRQLFSSLGSINGSAVRLTLQSAVGASCAIGSMFIGAGAVTAYNFTGNQVQAFVGGSGSFVIPANSSVVTDPINYPIVGASQFLAAFYFNGTSSFRYTGVGGRSFASKLSADETSLTTVSGYSATANVLCLINKVEVS